MSENDAKQASDPFSQMVQFYDDWTKNWSGAMSNAVSSRGFADSMSRGFADSMAEQTESSLGAMGMIRRQMGELMEQSLQQMSLPTRSDMLSLAQRMTSMEMRLDDMEAKLDEVLDLLKAR
jgi:polyhydroxyalkanoate synthesis regulator phasin